jgi:uncharacterized membrane protein
LSDLSVNHRLCRSRLAVLATALAAAVFLGGTVVAPWLESTGGRGAALVRWCYASVCHQQPERSLPVAGSTQAVCARCSGLYAGGLAGLLVGAIAFVGTDRRPRPLWLGLLLLPTIADALLALARLPSLPNAPRWLLAAPLGTVAGLFVAVAIADVMGGSARAGLPESIETAGAE